MTTATLEGVQVIAARLLAECATSGGATLALDGSTPRHGYVVGRPPYGDIVPTDGNAIGYVTSWIAGLPTDVKYVGIWRDSETGLVHVDAVDIYTARHEAHGACERRGELAYYSLHEGIETRVSTDERLWV